MLAIPHFWQAGILRPSSTIFSKPSLQFSGIENFLAHSSEETERENDIEKYILFIEFHLMVIENKCTFEYMFSFEFNCFGHIYAEYDLKNYIYWIRKIIPVY
jgi:hypothetical protein